MSAAVRRPVCAGSILGPEKPLAGQAWRPPRGIKQRTRVGRAGFKPKTLRSALAVLLNSENSFAATRAL